MAAVWVGTYKYVSSENFAEFMGAMGVSEEMKKKVKDSKPEVKIEIDGDNWTITNINPDKSMAIKFKLNEEFDHTTPDGRKVKCKVVKEGPTKIVMNQKEPKTGKESTITREVDGKKLTATFKCGSVVATSVYEKK